MASFATMACFLSSVIPAHAFQPSRISNTNNLAYRNAGAHTAVVAGNRRPIFMSAIDVNGAIISTANSTKSATTAKTKHSFDSFDYNQHWYPMTWAQDVPLNQPIRVTLFDVDYVLAKTGDVKGDEEQVFFAMLDQCPHKKVALSEGRITDCGTSDKRYLQCSYHGWTFDGDNGQCMEIPQTVIAAAQKDASKSSSNPQGDSKQTRPHQPTKKRREDATSVAVRVVQNMVWIQPNYSPLEAFAAMEQGTLLPPPEIPEMNMPGYKSMVAIRDFPIDWTVLMENIMDPDHGFFAHGPSGTSFDLYSADGAENVQSIEEDLSSESGWKITSSVNAVDKLVRYNLDVRSNTPPGKEQKKDESPPRIATTTFVAPSLIYMGRRENSTTTPSAFVTGFWVCPTGTGKSRFMSAAIGKLPVSFPRWLVHMNLNNFLDQDTFLLCGQHRAVLKREAEGYNMQNLKKNNGAEKNDVRKSTYVYRSPSERMAARIGQYFDATLARVPNRRDGVLTWYNRNSNNKQLLLEPWPSREEVLDRYSQHTQICPDSMDVVKRCEKVMKSSKLIGLALIFMKVVSQPEGGAMAKINVLPNPASKIPIIAAIRQVSFQSSTLLCGIANRIITTFLQQKSFYSILAFAFLSYSAASRLRREFYFKFDDELHRKDIKDIVKNWVDL